MPGASLQKIRKPLTLLILAVSITCWWRWAGFGSITPYQIAAISIALLATIVPALHSAVARLANWLNVTLAPRRDHMTLAIGLLTGIFLLIFAAWNKDSLFLKINDEHAYMIGAQMAAVGRLWMPAYPHDVAPFFDALCMIGDRVYAPMYFPGTALAAVPFIWLRLPFWLMPLLSASVCAALFYRIISDLFDPVRGLIGVLLLASLPIFYGTSLLMLSEMPFLAAELTMIAAWLAFRRKPGWRSALLIGISAGFGAITRPLDALCFALPIGLAIGFQLRKDHATMLRSAAVIFLGALPLLLVLLIQDIGVTGHWDEFAETHFTQENYPAPLMGFYRVDLRYIPPGMNSVKQQWLRDWILPSYRNHTPMNAFKSWPKGRLPQILRVAAPNTLLRILIPLAVFSLFEWRRFVITAGLAIFVIWNIFYLFLLDHYIVAVLPSIVCLILMGWESILTAWPRVGNFLLLSIFFLSLEGMWNLQEAAADSPDQRPANTLLAHLPITPAVVLFRFDPRIGASHDDPVYNDSVAFPDDAPVVRARDLGPEKDRDLIRYYAERQPDRVFYIYDPDARAAGENPLSPPLGTARELNARN
jgi:hypothetical protein